MGDAGASPTKHALPGSASVKRKPWGVLLTPPDEKKAPAEAQYLGEGDIAKRSVRRQHLCRRLHAAGSRPVLEALLAVESGQPLDEVLEDFARVPSSFFSILGASSFARIRAIFTGSSKMTFAEKKIDYGLIPVIEVADILFGQERGERTSGDERHFANNGGLFVNLKKNRWYCHGESTGGDAIDLIRFANDCDYKAAFDWLRSHGYESFLGEPPTPKKVLKEYDYTDENGARLYQTVRYEPKDFRQRRPDGNGGWIWKGPERAVPYKLPELIASGNAPVLIAGGEKDVDNLRALRFTATCNHGGEGKWWPELNPYFRDRRVFLLCDNDEPGEKHQQVAGAALKDVAAEIRVVRFPELEAKGDVSDLIARLRKEGRDDKAIGNELRRRFKEAPAWEPEAPNAATIIIATPDDEWPEPVSLPEGLSPVAPLDTALLPKAIAPWICDISERMQCPPDYVGSTALTALGSVLGRRIGIAPDRQTDWFEVPNLWQCAVGRPGAMKTPAIGEALKPLHRLEVKAREKYEAEAVDHGKALYEWKLQKEAAEARARADLKKNPEAKV
jgi:Protein of unknown function (DUF3987)